MAAIGSAGKQRVFKLLVGCLLVINWDYRHCFHFNHHVIAIKFSNFYECARGRPFSIDKLIPYVPNFLNLPDICYKVAKLYNVVHRATKFANNDLDVFKNLFCLKSHVSHPYHFRLFIQWYLAGYNNHLAVS
jgi:hypothetical protein